MSKHSEKLRSIVESTEFHGIGGVELSLAQPEVAACTAAQLGGEDRMRECYPLLYRSYLNGRENPADLSQSSGSTGFCDMAIVLDVAYDAENDRTYAVGNLSLTGCAARICMTLDIYEEDKLIGHNTQFFSSSWGGNIETYSVSGNSMDPNRNYKAYMQATWETANNRTLRTMVATANGTGTSNDVIDSVEVTHPSHQKTKEPGPIVVAYNRVADKADYSYPEARDPITDNEKVMLDVVGKAFFKAGYTLSSVDSNLSGAVLLGSHLGDIIYMGSVQYGSSQATGVFFPIEENGKKGIGWKLEKDWKNEIPMSSVSANRIYDFDLSIYFRCVEDQSLHHLLLTSKDIQILLHQNHCKKVPQIQLYWGCLAGDTLILMEDGSEKPISQLSEGSRIRNGENGDIISVNQVIAGSEAVMYVLRTVNGREIRASIDHPFLTDKGYMAVRDLCSGLSIRMQDGSYSKIDYCYPEAQMTPVPVYNLELPQGYCSFIANGMVSGSNQQQGELLKQAQLREASLTPDPEIEAEYRKMKADLTAGLL